METHLADFIRDTPEGREADAILRRCVHCGFCTATCPTYQILGDELDGPRGRIYLIKEVLEGAAATRSTQIHLDRCLTCRSCETTCPSGVEYGHLVDIGRAVVERQIGTARPPLERVARWLLRETLTRPALFGPAYALGQSLRAVLPRVLREKVLARRPRSYAGVRPHPRRMLLAQGCVQRAMAPQINDAAARVLDVLGIQTLSVSEERCCGAVRQHLDDPVGARAQMRANIERWTIELDKGVESIVSTTSGCGVLIKDYGHLLADDPEYRERAARVAGCTRDLGEVVFERLDEVRRLVAHGTGRRVAYHAPCTLQHGQQLEGQVEEILRAAAIEVTPCADAHLCCGSAGTYSVLQRTLSQRLRDDKLRALEQSGAPEIVSANIGCLAHLQGGTRTPVRHWIEVLDEALAPAAALTAGHGTC